MDIKKILFGLGGLLVSLIILQVVLNLLKKVPVVGGFAQDAQNLATEGHI